ncbi:hypothetical protein JCM10207_006650 [Rhodosporidiobolus poonsookiae]
MHWSPQVSLVQCICDFYILLFAFAWIWRYDRWATFCFWRKTWSKKLFMRVMLIGYLTGYPMHIVYNAFLATIKYRVGFFPMTGVSDDLKGQPVPYLFWSPEQLSYIKPIEWLIVYTWTSELICHSEEVFYFLYLLNLKPTSRGWWSSVYAKATIFFAVSLPILFIALNAYFAYGYSSDDLYHGSVFQTQSVISTTFAIIMTIQNSIFSFYIIPKFPSFIRSLEEKGASPDLLRRAVSINRVPWAVDVIIMFGWTGYFLGACLTLVIFLPVRNAYDHLAFSPPHPSAAAISSAGPYFAHSPTDAAESDVVPAVTSSRRRRPTLPISHILRLPLHRAESDSAAPSPLTPPDFPIPGADADSKAGNEPSEPPFSDSGAATGAQTSGPGASHPYSSLNARRATRMAVGAAAQSGFATTGRSLAPLIHPDIIGFTSPIDVPAWVSDVRAAAAVQSPPDDTIVEIVEDKRQEDEEARRVGGAI